MPLIKSISGIRGTIGGTQGTALTPVDIVAITTAFGKWIQESGDHHTVVLGRDARISGEIIGNIVASTLQSLGIHVIDIGLAATPTIAMATMMEEQANGGIAITASHNTMEWNALKLFNHRGNFIDAIDNRKIAELAEQTDHVFATVDALGSYKRCMGYIDKHIEAILALPIVATATIQNCNFRIAVDGINSIGGVVVPKLLKALGVKVIKECNCVPNGYFSHNPEPLPEHLVELSEIVGNGDYDLGIAVDPDVDRLAILDEKGKAWGEDYTLVGVVDYVLQHQLGNVVANLSSTNALRDITLQRGGSYTAAAVGEVNVVAKMKETKAVVGGEGNGGVIYPSLHYGRDALVGIALLLSHLAIAKKTASALRASYPSYFTIKDKIQVNPNLPWHRIVHYLKAYYNVYHLNTEDGLKVDQGGAWVHLRMSNTEPIIRIYAEATTREQAAALVKEGIDLLHNIESNLL